MAKKHIIVVSGSLSYDRIMDFPGRFRDHILPEKIHILNVSFPISRLQESFGGTAGNIAYNLSLLGEKPIVLAVVGRDFAPYQKWLKQHKINITLIKQDKRYLTPTAHIITDQEDNQITGFYGGNLSAAYCQTVNRIKKIDLAIIAPDSAKRMVKYARLYQARKITYIFDPGQQITSLSNADLRLALRGAFMLIGNDYEIQIIIQKMNLSLSQLTKQLKLLVITKGSKGSIIYHQNKKIIIPPAKPKNTSDPTGAGDAYRAGFIKGLLEGWPLEKVGRLAGLVSVYTVEKYGTQTHYFSWRQLQLRYKKNFKQTL
ncbi:carbohydrate kinase family protein [Candidatus Parcubacteria bacterium]|nr:MAG: carbohydrate kinase family protein [Candidatus Parcubacteria bacterium]